MKKVCLITYVKSPNYGAALQLFATYKAIEGLGHKVIVANYQNKYESEKSGIKYLLSNATIKEKAREYIAGYLFGVKRNSLNNFNTFYSLMEYTDKITTIEELMSLNEVDIFCVGSDQVWNPYITDGFDEVFILNTNKPAYKISYASSMGSAKFGDYSNDIFLKSISRFDCISVRERVAYDYLLSNTDKKVTQVVDPTMLISKAEWNAILLDDNNSNYQEEENKYVLVYALGGCFEQNRVVAQEIADRLGAKVYAITLSNRPKRVDKMITNATPLDFIRLINNASFVVTNSFHGTSFSLLMQTPFYSVRFGDNPARAEELLHSYRLDRRLFKKNDTINESVFDNTDILNTTDMINNNSIKSRQWLKSAIDGYEKRNNC